MKTILYPLLLAILLFFAPGAHAQITGAGTACVGTYTTLSDATAGGTWSSDNTAVAVVGSGSGVVTGVSAGTATISYTTGISTATTILTIFPAPFSMKGTFSLCEGSASILVDSGGNTWSSSNPAVVAFDSSIETVVSIAFITTLAPGTSDITFTTTNGCTVIQTVIVSAIPPAVSGTDSVCIGATTILSDITPGGIWTSSDTSVAAIDSFTGVLTGRSAGYIAIFYSRGGCYVSASINVTGQPDAGSIWGPDSICIGIPTTIGNAVGFGTWASSNTSLAVIAPDGMVTGKNEGPVTITFTATNFCGTKDTVKTLSVITCTDAVQQVSNTAAAQMEISPNPNQGTFILHMPAMVSEPVHVVISDLLGKTVADFMTAANRTDEIKMNQPGGVYLLSASSLHSRYNAKVVIAR